ncbi:MAG: heme exporter protein CcmB [Rhizobiales bacterium]|nr:heme exporter protein CcmB [Hyphomicrobiales bacterium]
MGGFGAIFLRDLKAAVRAGGGALTGVLFFLAVVTLVPFALGPDLALLRRIAPAILWLGALLSSLLTVDRLLAADQEDGSLDLMLMARMPLEFALVAKALAQWLTTALPLVLAAPFRAVALTLLAGTPALTFIGLVGASVAVTLRRGGLLLPVLTMPLAVPVLIFGVSASNAAVAGPVPFGAPFAILCATTLAAFVVGTFAAAAALRQGLE